MINRYSPGCKPLYSAEENVGWVNKEAIGYHNGLDIGRWMDGWVNGWLVVVKMLLYKKSQHSDKQVRNIAPPNADTRD